MQEKNDKVIDVEPDFAEAKPGRRGDGGTYLVVADDSEEFDIALRYAARVAQAHRGHVGVLHVVDLEEFLHWGSVESLMKKEMREKAEKYIWGVAKKVYDLNGQMPSLYLQEGDRNAAILKTIEEDPRIVQLVLGAAKGGSPGPLVAYFTGKGTSKLKVPVVVVPGHLERQKIDSLT